MPEYVKVDVSSLRTGQLVMFYIAEAYKDGTTYDYLLKKLDITRQRLSEIFKSLEAKKYIRRRRVVDLPEYLRDRIDGFGKMTDNRYIKIFPTKKGIRYINYILEQKDLDILKVEISRTPDYF